MRKALGILILAADGVEDSELITVYDGLIRFGFNVDICYVTKQNFIETQYKLQINANKKIKDVMLNLDMYSGLYLPGGKGVINLDKLPELDTILEHFFVEDKVVGALCAAPTLLAKRGYLKNKKATVYPDYRFEKILEKNGAIIAKRGCTFGDQSCEVVVDGKIVTGLEYRSGFKFVKAYTNLFSFKN